MDIGVKTCTCVHVHMRSVAKMLAEAHLWDNADAMCACVLYPYRCIYVIYVCTHTSTQSYVHRYTYIYTYNIHTHIHLHLHVPYTYTDCT